MLRTDSPEEKLAKLFVGASVTRIIFVDDDFDADDDALVLSAVLEKLEKDCYLVDVLDLLASFGIHVFDVTGQPHEKDVIANSLRAFWDVAEEGAKCDLCDKIGLPDTRQDTKAVSRKLEEIALEIEALTVNCFSIKDWDHNKESILGKVDGDDGSNTLIFFDKDLKYSAYGEDGGNTLINEVLESGNDSLFPGIFTGEATDVNEELEKTVELSGQGILAPVVGKYRIYDMEKFKQGVELFLVLNGLDALKRLIVEAYCDTAEISQLFMAEADYYTAYEAVCGSKREGVFLGDELRRILERLHFERYGGLIRDRYVCDRKAKMLDNIANISLPDILHVSDEKRNEVRRKDTYVEGAQLSWSGMPIDIGDIFKITDTAENTRYYILLSQPCNLAVRSNGKRTASPKSLTLVQIKEDNGEGSLDVQEKRGRVYRDIVPIVGEWANCYIDFAEQMHIPPEILDLCVCDPSGRSRIATTTTKNPRTVEPGWERLLVKLREKYTGQIGEYARLTALLPSEMDPDNKAVLEQVILRNAFGLNDCWLGIEMASDNEVAYGIERIGRLRESYSHGLLIEYARYQSRPGYPSSLLGSN